MTNEKLYKVDEVCEQLQISPHTLLKWYQWEKYSIRDGKVTEQFLPQPIKLENQKGQPKAWTQEQIEQLKVFKENMVFGRNGRFGKYSNPLHNQKKEEKLNGNV